MQVFVLNNVQVFVYFGQIFGCQNLIFFPALDFETVVKSILYYKIITDCYIRVCESLELPPVIYKATSSINTGISFDGVPFVYIHTPNTKCSHCFHVKDLATSRIVSWWIFLCCSCRHVCTYYVRLVSFVVTIYPCKMILLDFMMTIIKD